MAKIRNKSRRALEVPGRGTVEPDGVIEVSDATVYSYTVSANWEPVDKAASAGHGAGERAEAEAVKAEQRLRGVVFDEEPPAADE